MGILAKAVGRRKEAVAQVQIKQGTGQFIINNKPAQEYLHNDFYSLLSVKAPFDCLLISKQTDTVSANLELTPANLNLPINPNSHSSGNGNAGEGEPVLPQQLPFGPYNPNNVGEGKNHLNLDTIVKVKGGGLMGQTEAIRLGISRAICLLSTNSISSNLNPLTTLSPLGLEGNQSVAPASLEGEGEPLTISNALDIRKQLKDKGYLTQDSRIKERRKYGLKKARKASQYHKR